MFLLAVLGSQSVMVKCIAAIFFFFFFLRRIVHAYKKIRFQQILLEVFKEDKLTRF